MHIAWKTSLIATPILLLIACGNGGSSTTTNGTGAAAGSGGASSSSTTSTGGSGPSAAQACADQAHASCEEREKCSMNGYLNDLTYGSEMACEARAVLTCPLALMAKDTAQTPAHIEQCVAAYPSYSCTDYSDSNPPAACIPPPGGLADGAPCGASAQCMSTFCALGPWETCGTCQPLPAVGATCYAQGDCGRNLACAKAAGATNTDPGVCANRVMMGGSCVTGQKPCASGLDCVGENAMTMAPGTCQVQGGAVGAACDTTSTTAANCNPNLGLRCIPDAGTNKGPGTCQAITLVAAGMPCGVLPGAGVFTSFAACEGGGRCVPSGMPGVPGTCMAPAADGAACDNNEKMGPPCLSPAKCVTGNGNVDAGTAGTCTLADATKCM